MDLTRNISILLMMFIGIIGFHQEILAQEEKHDVIVKLDGKKLEGKVVSVSSTAIKFKYAGEDLEYELKKDEINKIEFASGRVEVVNELAAAAPVTATPTVSAEERRNKLAVLPFEIITNDEGIMVDAIRAQAQNECANSFRKNTSLITVQDPMITNSILQKHGIDYNHLATAANPKELAEILGVEFVVFGSSDIEYKGTRTYGSSATTYKEKEKEKDRKNNETKGTVVSSGSSSTLADYDTRVGLKIFNDRGESVYSDSRDAFGSDTDSYTNSLSYMIKRTPWGSKHK
ncbi:hypothetical protein [Echinicola shivajiensis]|uniref:hypothetical protein n=1 Tax=Echinicola shivajiensis TaxID=1035916 RepID=UPI001BFC4A70|nr:hypothetical protein [Echinicola shivajiensis]